MRRKHGSVFGLLLLLTLCAHALVLSWLQQQLPGLTLLRAMPEPLFTRLVTPAPARVPTLAQRSVPGLTTPPLAQTAPAPTEQSDPSGPALESSDPPDQPPTPESQRPPAPGEVATESALSATATALEGWPPDTRVSYDLRGYYRGDLHGSAKVQWQQEQGRYQVRIDISTALLLRASMISQGSVGEQGLLPEVYEEQFLWGQRRLRFESDRIQLNSGEWIMKAPGVQDAASQFVELVQRFASARQILAPGAEVQLWLARPEGMALWTYDVTEEEWLDLPELGRVPAFGLRPRPIANPSGNISAEIWFAPTLKYLPVRIRISIGSNSHVDLLAERVEQSAVGAAPTPLLSDTAAGTLVPGALK